MWTGEWGCPRDPNPLNLENCHNDWKIFSNLVGGRQMQKYLDAGRLLIFHIEEFWSPDISGGPSETSCPFSVLYSYFCCTCPGFITTLNCRMFVSWKKLEGHVHQETKAKKG